MAIRKKHIMPAWIHKKKKKKKKKK